MNNQEKLKLLSKKPYCVSVFKARRESISVRYLLNYFGIKSRIENSIVGGTTHWIHIIKSEVEKKGDTKELKEFLNNSVCYEELNEESSYDDLYILLSTLKKMYLDVTTVIKLNRFLQTELEEYILERAMYITCLNIIEKNKR